MRCPLETAPLPEAVSLDAFLLSGTMLDAGLDPMLGVGMVKAKWFFGLQDLFALGKARAALFAGILERTFDGQG
jgi:hypothetical protein